MFLERVPLVEYYIYCTFILALHIIYNSKSGAVDISRFAADLKAKVVRVTRW